MIASLVCAIPPLLLFAGFPGPIAFVTGALLGIFVDASLSVTLVSAQRLMPGRTGVALRALVADGYLRGPRLLVTGPPISKRGAHLAFMYTSHAPIARKIRGGWHPWGRNAVDTSAGLP